MLMSKIINVMTLELFIDILKDALKDSLLVFFFVFLVHFVLAFVEEKLTLFLTKRKKTAPIIGSLFGLVPQCGTSVLGADLYIKRYISIGTLVAIFLSCSDEALIVMLTSANEKTIMVLPLIGLKFVIGFVIGILVDSLFRKQELHNDEYHEDHHCHLHHEEDSPEHKYLFHPLIHSLQILAYVFVINLALGLIIGFVGQENFVVFLTSNRYLAPLYSSTIGLIPNCASSILISELYMNGHLSFGALLAGLLVNSGLGMMMIIKNRKAAKNVLLILLICFVTAILSGYLTCLVGGF